MFILLLFLPFQWLGEIYVTIPLPYKVLLKVGKYKIRATLDRKETS